MSNPIRVGSRELKTRLGHYLQRVRQGETIVVTDRDEPVAELRPLQGRTVPLQKLAARGIVTLPKRGAATDVPTIRARGAGAAAAVSKDRDERG